MKYNCLLRLHLASDQNRCRSSQPDIRQRSENLGEELWERLGEPEEIETPQEDQQS